ncbi:SpoIIE family protein phosphatase [Nonomuraea sp. NEAU-A123]|uniref:SpoIIE family protein phosphatase n=1 Tax=Nonomuraea sp. NEAU-A123 TaxID=2839649 RepID=UPI001BE3DB3B|nr:SpoIIE family protein phosphatase [Nonomuraea sp. NEAU-A123]MBT2227915.1 SpoIIE family protein phosphatase [Nonomuraea sp. NEAU-A123]
MTFIVITILLSCLSVMAVRGHRGTWPPGMPVARPRLSAVGGTYEGSHRRPSDAYVIQERLIAAASGADGNPSAALALGAVVAARPHYAGTQEADMDNWAQAVHHSVRTASLRDPATSGLVSTLDLIILDLEDSPCLRFAHVGDGAIWHCARSEPPHPLTTPRSLADGSVPREIGLAYDPQVGTVSLRPGDRVVIVTNGAIRALGVPRMRELFAGGPSPAACLDRVFDEMAAVEPKDDATVVIADYVTT